MGEPRPMFRFRLPWMIPSAAPDPRPEVAAQSSPTPLTTPQIPTASAETQTPAPAQRRPFRFASITASQPPPPPQTQTSLSTDSQLTTTETQAPPTQTTLQTPTSAQVAASTSSTSVPPKFENKSATETTTTAIQPQTLPMQVSVQEPLPQAEPLSTTQSRPSSPSRASIQSQDAFQPPSPARVSPQAQAVSETFTPAVLEPQESPQTIRQPQGPKQSLLPFESSDQTTKAPSFPSLAATNIQPTGATTTQALSPSKRVDAVEPLPTSNKALSPISEKEQNLAVPQPLSLEAISTSQVKATIQPNVSVTQLSKQSGRTEVTAPAPVVDKEAPFPTTKSDDYPKSITNFDMETKKEKEMVHTTAVAHQELKHKAVAEYLTDESGLVLHKKEQPKVARQLVENKLEKQEMVSEKEVPNLNISNLNGKPTKTMNSPRIGKGTASGSLKKPMVLNGEQVSLQKELRHDIFKLVRKMSNAHPEHHTVEEKVPSMVCLVGENTGASMKLDSEVAGRGAAYVHRSKYSNTKEDQVTETYINNNVQNINNSIVLNSSIAERNPGIHLAVFHYPTESIKSTNRTESVDTRKMEVNNIIPSKKLIYNPTIFRGLYMDLSDSDPDNPKKCWSPVSSHGCRDENTDTEINVT